MAKCSFWIIKYLKPRNYIYITKPDKGSGEITLNNQDYIDKMPIILSDFSKFKWIVAVRTCDNTTKLKTNIQIWLFFIYNSNLSSIFYFQNRSLVYTYKCRCDAVYIERTNERLKSRIAQCVPAYLRSSSWSCLLRTTQSVQFLSITRQTKLYHRIWPTHHTTL